MAKPKDKPALAWRKRRARRANNYGENNVPKYTRKELKAKE